MQFSWNEKKRRLNIRTHGLEFVDCVRVFAGPTLTFEDDRLRYPERRYVTLGLLEDIVVSVVHTESQSHIRIISFRKATRNEKSIFFQSVGH